MPPPGGADEDADGEVGVGVVEDVREGIMSFRSGIEPLRRIAAVCLPCFVSLGILW